MDKPCSIRSHVESLKFRGVFVLQWKLRLMIVCNIDALVWVDVVPQGVCPRIEIMSEDRVSYW